MPIRVVSDSTCDLPHEVLSQLGITVVPLYINLDNQSYLDGVDITRREFYERLAKSDSTPTTAAPSPQVFRQTYEQLAEQGATQVLSIHIASSLSATVEAARAGARETQALPVTVVDSKQLSLGVGFLVQSAARAASEGQSLSDILENLKTQIAGSHVFAAADTLEFLRRSGRLSAALAGVGRILSIKPLLRMYDGVATAGRVRTQAAAERKLIAWLGELAPLEQVALVHANAPERVERLKRMASDLLPEGQVWTTDITPVIGAHVGPGTVGFACVSRTPYPAD